jgi:HD-GYP domain-containing protein (c-di-GMP phosphodiesterase class II)
MDEPVLPMTQDAALYNARVVTLYLKMLRERYPHVQINDVLNHAGIELYEITDEGHWFTQNQIDRFYEKIIQLTGNQNIAREAGRLAASPGAIGIMRQYTLGLLGPARAFAVISKASKNFTHSSEYSSRPLRSNSVEIRVTPNPGVQERPFQCENRMGFFEAIIEGFSLGLPKIEHPECLFKGGESCRYIVTWKRTFASIAGKARNAVFAFSALGLAGGLLVDPRATAARLLPWSIFACLFASLLAEIARRREVLRAMGNLWDSSERLTEQINANSRNLQLTLEIGQALANKKSVDDVLHSMAKVMEKRLDFDCGAILLANPEKTRLEIRGAFGYSNEQLGSLTATVFHLDKPSSQGPFVLAFHQQKPFLVNDVGEIEEKLTPKSRMFMQKLGIRSFLCCPIIVEGDSLGILAVTNQTTKRPLVMSDVALLLGVAPVIGVALQNASLVEKLQTAFEKTLKILADSIDARDFLTAGHSEVVAEYAAGIAEEMAHDGEFVQMIRVAALLHDYGKIGVPDAILKKDGQLTDEERAIINTHPAKTREILSQVPFQGIQMQIPEITGAHHERWDGNGYPQGLKEESIPLGARILAVADFFEAITSKRHYRDPMPLDVALRELQQQSGTHFDPEVVNAFVRYLQSRKFCLITPGDNSSGTPYNRRSPRFEYRTQVSARYDRRVVSGSILDISQDGAYVTSTDPVDEKAQLILTFTPPGSEELVQLVGEVAWVNNGKTPASAKHPEGFGLLFKNVPESVQTLLNCFVTQNRRLSAPGKVIYPKQFVR